VQHEAYPRAGCARLGERQQSHRRLADPDQVRVMAHQQGHVAVGLGIGEALYELGDQAVEIG